MRRIAIVAVVVIAAGVAGYLGRSASVPIIPPPIATTTATALTTTTTTPAGFFQIP
jgi:hypothetical protein